MSAKINRILIPFIILLFVCIGKETRTTGQAPANSFFLPIISYNPTGWIGPYGGTIVAVAVDPVNPQVIYSGTFGSGVFKSTDGGNNWFSASRGLSNPFIYSLAIDPLQPGTLYAGTFHSQVYKSQDGGNSWVWSGAGIQDQAVVYSIAVDPIEPARLYAATRGISNGDHEPWNGVVYISTDAGQTWTPSLANVGGVGFQDWVYSLVINPNAHNQVFAATHMNSPFRSDDFGATWHTIHTGISDPSGRSIIISPQPEFSSTLYLGVWHFDSVYKTINSGDLWNNSNGGIPNVMVYSMAIDPHSVNSVYMATFSNGILRTADGAKTWQYGGLQEDQVYSIVINPGSTNNLFVGTSGDGLYRSLDASQSWQRTNSGINNADVTAVVHSPTEAYTIFSSVYGAGVFKSVNRGQTWQDLNAGLGDKFVHDLIMDPAHAGLLYALTDSGGLFKNDLNAGDGWVSTGGGLPLTQTHLPAFRADHPFATLDMQEAFTTAQDVQSPSLESHVNLLTMVYAPSDPQIAYMGTSGSGAYRSTNGGQTWLPAELGGQTVLSLAVDLTNPELVYAATASAGSLMLSIDGGKSWNNLYLPVNFYSVATSTQDSGVVFAGTSSGVYSYQSGSWLPLGLSDQTVTAIALDPIKPGVIIAGTTLGAYYTIDNGVTWNIINQQLSGQTIQSITFDRIIPNVIYFTTTNHGIYLAAIPL